MAGALFHCNGGSSTFSLSGLNPRRPSSMMSFCRTTVNAMSQSQSYWASIEADIEAHLKKAIPVRQPETVFEPMNELTFAAPRTKAPALCIAACELVGGRQDQAMAAASALHLMHSAAYVHEHLPSTDVPIPKPTIHHAYGPNIELLIGDGIVPFGFELLARSVDPAQNNSGRILRVTVEIARAVGSLGMVNGQYEEILVKISQPNDSEWWIEHVCKKKEGELYACAAACGAILGGGSEEEIENLRKYGLYAGTIQGMVNGLGGNERRWTKEVEKCRALALEELKNNFKDKKVESISNLVEANLCTAYKV